MDFETIKKHFDDLTHDDRSGDTINYYLGIYVPDKKPENPLLEIVCSALTSERRYDRYTTVLLRDIDGEYYITDEYCTGGDAEYRGFYGTIHPVSKEVAKTFIDFCAIDFRALRGKK